MGKTIQLSDELSQALDQIKEIISKLAGSKIESDEEVLEILIRWFIESLITEWMGGETPGAQPEGSSGPILTE